MTHTKNKHSLNSSTPISDQDRISPYNINQYQADK